jgi:hypothetical protein
MTSKTVSRRAGLAQSLFAAGCAATIFFGSMPFTAQAQINRKPLVKPSAVSSSAAKEPGINNGSRTTPLPNDNASTNIPCTSAVIWDNGPFNSVNGLASEENTQVTNARAADDFVLTGSANITQVTADILATPGDTFTGNLDIFPTDTSGTGPSNTAPALASVTSTNFTVVGSAFSLDVRRYVFTLPGLALTAGRYWVNPYLSGSGTGRGFFCTSNGATPSSGQIGHFKSTQFGFANWTPVDNAGIGNGPEFAFTVSACAAAGGPQNVDSQVTFTTTTQGLTGIAGSCATAGYTNQYNINVDLRNIGTNTFTNPFFQVIELQQTDGTPTANPFRLRTADDFNAATCSGGIVGTTQAIPGPIVPAQVIPVNFQIAMPQLRRFRFLVSVFATVGSPNSRNGKTVKLGELAVTGLDRGGKPVVSATFTPEKGQPSLAVANVKATSAR